MALDIYFHQTKLTFKGDETNSDDLFAFTKEVDELAKENIGKKLRNALKPLRKLWKESHSINKETGKEDTTREWILRKYNTAYFDFVAKVLKPTIAWNYEFKIEPYTQGILPFPELEEKVEIEIRGANEKYDVYFRKVNFLFRYFKDKGKMVEEWFSFVTKEDVDDIIYRCEIILKDHEKAEEYLPTQSGFFFGSTDYNDWYFDDVKDCLKKMKKYRKLLKDGVTGYVIFSW